MRTRAKSRDQRSSAWSKIQNCRTSPHATAHSAEHKGLESGYNGVEGRYKALNPELWTAPSTCHGNHARSNLSRDSKETGGSISECEVVRVRLDCIHIRLGKSNSTRTGTSKHYCSADVPRGAHAYLWVSCLTDAAEVVVASVVSVTCTPDPAIRKCH